MDHGQENNPRNRVWFRSNSNQDWIEIYNLWSSLRTAGIWKTVQIFLSPYLVTRGLTYTDSVQIRFGQEDDNPTLTTVGVDG